MSGFFGYRLCPLFDIRVKLNLPNINDLSLSDTTTIKDHDTSNNHEDDILMIINSDYEVNNKFIRVYNYNDEGCNDFNIVYNNDNDNNFNIIYNDDNNNNSNLSLCNNINENYDTDNKCIIKFKKT